MTCYNHDSVLPGECLEQLAVKPDGVYVDATAGGGGHTALIAGKLTSGHVYGFDKDDVALEAAAGRLVSYKNRVTLLRGDFRNMKQTLAAHGVDGVNGVLFDLGVSSPQLDDAARGFSYRNDAPLDMRMDRSQNLTARDIVNGWPEAEIARVLRDYGEERYAARIASAIARNRERAPVETTSQLVEIIRKAMPGKALREDQHPARRTFQALRIAVGDELGALREGLASAIDVLIPGGRVACISFHSLEDRIVKQTFVSFASGCECPPDFPVCTCKRTPSLRLLTKKPVKASPGEIDKNPRARSAVLRAAEKLQTRMAE
jgi:16S rRNA (cytosine1402-N4)-methyltransferase